MSEQNDIVRPAAVLDQPKAMNDAHAKNSQCPVVDVEIVVQDGVWDAVPRREEFVYEAMLALSRVVQFDEPCTAALALSNDEHISQLNSAYRDKQGATNVLSFPSGERAAVAANHARKSELKAPARYLGDIIMAFETVSSEAQAMQIPLADHFRHLVLHGVLHLLGHDHETDAEAATMEAIEVETLALLGISDPYDDRRAV